MRKQKNLDWIPEVLEEIAVFLAINQMEDRAIIIERAANEAGFKIDGWDELLFAIRGGRLARQESNVVLFRPKQARDFC